MEVESDRRSRSQEESPRRGSRSASRSPSPLPRKPVSRSPSRSRSRSRERFARSRSPPHTVDRDAVRDGSPRGRDRRGPTNRPPADPSNVLGVFGLSHYTRQRDLEEIFSKYGRIKEAMIVMDRRSNQSRGFGFIYFDSVQDAERALRETNGMRLDGKYIRVDFSATKRPHEPTPGVYMGERRDADAPRSYRSERDYGRDRERGPDRYYRRRSRSPRRSSRSRSRSRSRGRYAGRDARDMRDARSTRDARDTRDFRDMRDVRDTRDARDMRDTRDTRDVRSIRRLSRSRSR